MVTNRMHNVKNNKIRYVDKIINNIFKLTINFRLYVLYIQ